MGEGGTRSVTDEGEKNVSSLIHVSFIRPAQQVVDTHAEVLGELAEAWYIGVGPALLIALIASRRKLYISLHFSLI